MRPAGSGGAISVVTGARGTGKTTFCSVLVDAARSRRPGLAAGGILSPKILRSGREVAISVVDVASGDHRRLATRREPADPYDGPFTTRWRFDVDALAWGDTILRSATPCDLLIVDELGPLEFERGEGWTGGLAAVDTGAYGAAFVVVRPELVDRALERWQQAGVLGIGSATEAAVAAWRSGIGLFRRLGDL